MYVIQSDTGNTILTGITDKIIACQTVLDMVKADIPIKKLLKYSGVCHKPKVTVIIDLSE